MTRLPLSINPETLVGSVDSIMQFQDVKNYKNYKIAGFQDYFIETTVPTDLKPLWVG